MNLNESPIYNIWRYIKRVCENPAHDDYRKYGGRGIKVSKEWKNDFKSFYRWAMKKGYGEGKKLARLDLSGDFSPSNCIILTSKQNWYYSRNKAFPNSMEVPHKLKKWNSKLWEAERKKIPQ